MKLSNWTSNLKQSRLFKDSFWAVFGNGTGYGLLLIAGILVARFLGKDLYGEYGLIKTTMFHIAAFSTFGLGYTSTKFVAEYKKKDKTQVNIIIDDSLLITAISSIFLASLFIIFAVPLAEFLNEPKLYLSFRMLGGIIIFKAISTTQNGILAGLGEFKRIAINNVIAGVFMMGICVPLTFYWGLLGSLISLMLSQIINSIVNYYSIKAIKKQYPIIKHCNHVGPLLKYSVPVALQELSYSASQWGISLLLVKYSSFGEMGLYSAASQWNAIIMFIPGLLSNVILSHLSSYSGDKDKHKNTLKKMLIVNLLCTVIPFLVVYLLSHWITSFYGTSFDGLSNVLRISVFATIFICCSRVFQSELISIGKTWLLLCIRLVQDCTSIGLIYYFLIQYTGIDGAYYASLALVIASILTLICYVISNMFLNRK